jgi:hypothetical protein
VSTPEYDELEEEFGEVMALLRGGLPETPTDRPGDGVWASIAAELGQPVGVPNLHGDAVAGGVGVAGGGDGGSVVRDISSARSRRWGRPVALLTAAAAVLLVAVPLALAFGGGGEDPIRRADLAALGGWEGQGQAELVDHDLTVSVDGGPAPDGAFYELWLLDLDGDELRALHSLGRLGIADDGTFVVPDDVDLDRFDVVDISIEPDDGNPDHSGQSILRGGLTEA